MGTGKRNAYFSPLPLDDIKAFADLTPPPQGMITGFTLGTAQENAEDLVKITSDQAGNLETGDQIEIKNTQLCDGFYEKVTKISDNSFIVEHPSKNLGNWEKVEEEGGLIFEGMVTAYEKLPDGKLKVTAYNHGLVDGDAVLIQGTGDYNDTFPIRRIDDAHFVIEHKWQSAEAVNVRIEALKRRGIILDGKDDYMTLPKEVFASITDSVGELLPMPSGVSIAPPGGTSIQGAITIEFWAKGGLPSYSNVFEGVNANNQRVLNVCLPCVDNCVYWDAGGNQDGSYDRIGKGIRPDEYQNWTHWAFIKDVAKGLMSIYRNGSLWHQAGGLTKPFSSIKKFTVGCSAGNTQYWNGTLADLRIWQTARIEQDIRNSMYLQLTGKEFDLVGYWRLGGIVEGKERKVVDFSVNAYDGTVYGGAYVGGVTLNRNLRDGTPAVKYNNSELFAVSQRAIYVEEFEFKVNGGKGTSLPKTLPVTNGLQVYLTGETLQVNQWSDQSGGNRHALIAPSSTMPVAFDVQNYNNKNFKVARFIEFPACMKYIIVDNAQSYF